MKHVMLVDDEVMYRDFLAHLIDWSRCGLSLAAMASDGPQALRMMESTPADIAIIDMIMPAMDGLSLIAAIRAQYPDTQLIALSGYDQYRLVSGAFRLSVSDYLLKTEINAEQLTGALRTLIQRSVSIDLQSGLVRWRDDDLAPLFSRTWAASECCSLLVVRGRLDPPDGIERIRLTPDVSAFVSDSLPALSILADAAADAHFPAILHPQAERLLSTLYADHERLSTAVWLDRNRVRTCECGTLSLNVDTILTELESCIRNASPFPAALLPDDADAYDPGSLGDFYRQLEARVQKLLETNIPECQEDLTAFLEEYAGPRRIAVLNLHLTKALAALRNCSRVNYYVLQEIQRYIQTGYASNISLGDLARQLDLSDSYLSRAIADSTGKTFSQLLFEHRMEQARLKIEAGETRVGELAASVGYASYESFSRAFKRAFRLSPQAYIRRHERGERM